MPWPTTYNSQGIFMVSLEGRIHGQQTVNTFWFSQPGELGTVDWPPILLAAATAVLECAVTTLLPGLSSQWEITGCRAKLMSAADKQEVFVPAAANSVGALGESLPSYCSIVIQWRTPYTGKSRRGRTGFAGVPEANQALSIASGVPVTQVAAFVACLLGKFHFTNGTETPDFIIYSRKLGFVAPSTYNAELTMFAPVASGAVRTDLGTVNSRKLRRGA